MRKWRDRICNYNKNKLHIKWSSIYNINFYVDRFFYVLLFVDGIFIALFLQLI